MAMRVRAAPHARSVASGKLFEAFWKICSERAFMGPSNRSTLSLRAAPMVKISGAVSPAAREFAMRYFPADYTIIPNGVDVATYGRPAPGRAAFDRPTVLFVGRYNEELVKAGVMLAGEGLHPSAKGVRIRFSGKQRSVVDGPFAETKELVAGFWLWQVRSMEEAIEWARRCPNPMPEDSELEIRPVFEDEDFGAEFTPELREQERRLRDEIAARG